MEIFAQGRCATASVKTRNSRWHSGPFSRARAPTFEMQHTGSVFFLCICPVHSESQQNKNKTNKKKKPKQSFYHYKFSYETAAAAFKIKVKVLSLKKQTKLPAKKPTSVQVCTSEDNSKDHYRPQFKLKHDSQTALEKNSSHCKSHLQLTSVLINTYTHTCHTHTNPSFPHPSVQSAA